MFVMTAKLSKPKLIAAGVILVGLIAALVMLLSGPKSTASSLPDGSSNEERAAYLATYGWSIDALPKETQAVTIPDPETNRVFARYNDLQISQGFDLLPYRGKEVTRFVYEILNYPEATAPVYAGVLVYEGKIIGGEITDTSPEGVIHGFSKPGTPPPSDSTEAPTTDQGATDKAAEQSAPETDTSADATVTRSASDMASSDQSTPDEAGSDSEALSDSTAPSSAPE